MVNPGKLATFNSLLLFMSTSVRLGLAIDISAKDLGSYYIPPCSSITLSKAVYRAPSILVYTSKISFCRGSVTYASISLDPNIVLIDES